uniref:TetR/AcrR family transcriptional regulator n=1 Tax=Weissella viridescens TaxID=1629 RepID=UPI003AA9DC56
MSKVNQEQIFQAAREVLDEKGYEKARLADVARKLDISSAALYKHFKIRKIC